MPTIPFRVRRMGDLHAQILGRAEVSEGPPQALPDVGLQPNVIPAWEFV
jgi:hypothetical protein